MVPPLDNKYYILSEQGVTNLVYHYRTYDEYSVEFTAFDVFGNEVRIYDERLCEAMKELTERRRNILLMSYFLEMTDAEIAEVMEMERFSVCRNRLHTLKLIRDMYEEG